MSDLENRIRKMEQHLFYDIMDTVMVAKCKCQQRTFVNVDIDVVESIKCDVCLSYFTVFKTEEISSGRPDYNLHKR